MKLLIEESASDFPILMGNRDYIYLDNAATTQKPRLVLDALQDYYSSCNANVHRAIHRWGRNLPGVMRPPGRK